MLKFFRKVLIMASIYVLCQLLLMLLVWIFFQINLFETSKSPKEISDLSVGGLKLIIGFNQFFGLLLPALLYLVIVYGKEAGKFISLDWVKRYEIYLVGFLALIFSFPVIQFLAQLNARIPLGDWMQSASLEINEQMNRIIIMDSYSDLLVNLTLIGLLPALAEELFFRGMLQNEMIRLFKNNHLGILVTAIIFSSFHFQFEGFLPRLYLGALLGYTFLYSKSFILPILVHFTNNAILVFSNFLSPQEIQLDISETVEINYTFVIISTIIVVFTIIWIKKIAWDEK